MARCQNCGTEGTVSGRHTIDFVEVCPDCGRTLRRRTANE
jgi:rRNA maturation endonuclease Nob1